MRSRAESRQGMERLLRLAALALLAVTLWRLVAERGVDGGAALHVRFEGTEGAATRDSLAALGRAGARAGARVTWSGALAPLAVTTERVREPSAAWRVSVVSDTPGVLADSLGAIDSVAAGGASLVVQGVRGGLQARVGSTTARVLAPAELTLGRVLVLGRVGWESKFVIAALEEEGWSVDAELALSDTLIVRQGGRGQLRVGTHAVVVVLDTGVGVRAAEITRFVRAGGGLLLAGEGTGARSLRALAAATVSRAEPRVRTFSGNDPFDALPVHLVGGMVGDAVTLDRHAGRPTTVARRVGAGRVIQSAYADTWRWRMEGEAGSPEAHRAHWSRLVGSAAFAESTPQPVRSPTGGDAVPLAATIQALGPPSNGARSATRQSPALPLWLGALILGLLLGEWASRRTRGAA